MRVIRRSTAFAFVVFTASGCGDEAPIGEMSSALSLSNSHQSIFLAKIGQGKPGPAPEPPYDLSAHPDNSAAALTAFSQKALQNAADRGRGAVMRLEADGTLYSEELDDVALAAEAGRYAAEHHLPVGVAPSLATAAVSDLFIEKGLSNASDARSFWGDPSYDADAWLSRVGEISTVCTGTYIGNRIVLTAAHCVAGKTWPLTFWPRRRGSVAPYGAIASNTMFWPTAFTANNCHVTYKPACVKYDIAWMIVPTGSPVGYLGFAYTSDSILATYSLGNIGYPICNPNDMPPPNCQSDQQYGDVNCGFITPQFSDGSTANAWPWGDGTNPDMATGCDTSSGHSGGGVDSYSPSPPGTFDEYVMGVTVWNLCWRASCTPSTQFSSEGARFNAAVFNYMLSLRSQYP